MKLRTVLSPIGWVSILMCVVASFVHAGGLKWEETVVSVKAQPKDQQAETIFAFTNTYSRPVEIKKISTSCGCTTAKLAKMRYQPGESGEVHVVFKFGGRKGTQVKSILVRTDEDAPDILIYRVEIPGDP